MTKTVQIDDDLYEFLRQQCDFGETVSMVLRRLLSPSGVPIASVSADVERLHVSASNVTNGHNNVAGDGIGQIQSDFMRFIADPAFFLRNPTEKYLGILAFAYKEKPEKFANVIEISGRRRKYFGRSREEIELSGTSTHPRLIHGSPYWAMTNADTDNKREMLSKVLQVLEYSAEEIPAAIKMLV